MVECTFTDRFSPGLRGKGGRLRELSGYCPKTGKTGTKHRYIKRLTASQNLARPAPPSTRHVRLRYHPGPGYGHAVDRHSTTSATSTAAVTRARPSTSCSASSKFSANNLRCTSEACVPNLPYYSPALLTRPHPLARISSFLKFPAKAPAVRRACTSCHSGKTRCSEILPCQVGTYLYPPFQVCQNCHPSSLELPQAWSRCHLCLSGSRGPR
jgi:hypothetical protein